MKKIVLIPSYNPNQKLIDLLNELSKYSVELVVVNDGSTNEYDVIFQLAQFKAIVLKHSKNKGKGEAVKTGLAYIQRTFKPPYTVTTADSDGQHLVKDIIKIGNVAEKYPEQLILGSRKINDNVPLRSKIGNTITRQVFKLSTGKQIYDTQTGLRAFSDKAVQFMLNTSGSRYEYEMNVLMKWVEEKRPYRELWIETIYIKNNSSSHFNTVKDSYRIYKEIIRFSASSFASFLLDYGLFNLFYLLAQIFNITQALVTANVSARIISATFNYTLNRKAVFKSDTSIKKSAVKYTVLAVAILVCNTVLLKFLIYLGIVSFLAKIITEIVMFFVSWIIQHKFIFNKKNSDNYSSDKELKIS